MLFREETFFLLSSLEVTFTQELSPGTTPCTRVVNQELKPVPMRPWQWHRGRDQAV